MINIRILFFALTILFHVFAFPAFGQQNNPLDSLQRLLQTKQPDTTRVQVLNDLSYHSAQVSKMKQAVQYAKQALALAKKIGYKEGMGEAWYRLGHVYVYQGKYQQSIKALEEALALFEQIPFPLAQAKVLYTSSYNYSNQGNYPVALQLNLKALRLLENVQESSAKAQKAYTDVLGAITNIYVLQQDFSKASAYANQALRRYITTKDTVGLIVSYVDLGNVHKELANYQLAQKYLQQALDIIDHITGNYNKYIRDILYIQHLKHRAYVGIGYVHLFQSRFSSALPYLKASLQYYTQEAIPTGRASCYVALAEAYRGLQQYEQSRQYLQEGMRIAQAAAEKPTIIEGYQVLAKLYQDQHQFEQALEVLQQRNQLKDSLFSAQNHRQLHAIEQQFENQQKEQQLLQKQRQIEQLEQQQQTTRLQLYLLLALTAGLLGGGWLLTQQSRLKRQRDKVQAALTKAQAARERSEAAAEKAAFREQQVLAQAQLERVQHQLELKNQGFTNFSLQVIQKNELINSLKEQIDRMSHRSNGSLQQDLQKLTRSIEGHLQVNNDWESFRLVFEAAHPTFLTTLQAQFPNLTPSELKLAALLKMNFASKDMAAFLGISEDSVNKARYRLRKKLGLEQEEGLVDFLTKLG